MENNSLTVTIPKSEYDSLKKQVIDLTQKVEWFMQQLKLSKHRQFGSSSEKTAYNQLSLFDEIEATADVNIPEPELTEIAKHFRKRKRLSNDRLPDDIPVEVIEHDLPENEQTCPECGGSLHVMGNQTRRELVFIPAQVKIIEHVKKIYACRNCEKNECNVPIIKAPVDNPVIKGSFASPEAIAHIMTQKFVMATPLYRQEQDLNRNGIMLSRQTMSNWSIKATEDYLEPIYGSLKERLCEQDNAHSDETTLQVLREPGKPAQSKSYMWLYRTGGYGKNGIKTENPIVLYDYQPDRKAVHPAEFLKGFKGYLHADGYEGYHSLPKEIIIVGCWAHVRRKFDEVLKVLSVKDREGSNAAVGKRYCDNLFELERKFSDMTPKERYLKRQELSKPLTEKFFAWAQRFCAMPKTPIGIAANYALGQRKYLETYLTDGRLEISNNRAERSIKPFVIGRKNFLFANTPRGAKASAIIYSLVETAKENNLNPFAYLTYIFKNAPNWDIRNNPDALQKLLPWFAPESCRVAKR